MRLPACGVAACLLVSTTLPASSQAGLAAVIARAGTLTYRGFNAGRKGRISLPKVPSDLVDLGGGVLDGLIKNGWPSDRHDQIFIALKGDGWRRYTSAKSCVIEPEVAPHQCRPCDMVVTPSGSGAIVTCDRLDAPPLTVSCSADGCSFPAYDAMEALRRQEELDKQAAENRVIREQEIQAQQVRDAQERARLDERQRFLSRARCAADETQSAGFRPYSAKLVSAQGDGSVSAYSYPGISERTRFSKTAGTYVTVLFDVARLDPPASIRTAPRLLCVSMESSLYKTVEYFYVDRANVVPYTPNRFERAFHDQ